MEYLEIRNWDRWQSYRSDRGPPPWIKLYRDLLHDPDFMCLTAGQRGELVSIWLLASSYRGRVKFDPSWIKKATGLRRKPDLQFFIDHGFMSILDANVASPWRHDDAPEGEAEADTDKEGNTQPVDNSTAALRQRLPDPPSDKSFYPSPPRRNGHDPRDFDTIKAHVISIANRFGTNDPEQIVKLGGQSCKLSKKQAAEALLQLRQDNQLGAKHAAQKPMATQDPPIDTSQDETPDQLAQGPTRQTNGAGSTEDFDEDIPF